MHIVGLMSGTSADGVDAALVEIQGEGGHPGIRLVSFATFPYPAGVRERILAVASGGTTADVCHLNALVGELFAEAVQRLVDQAGIPIGRVHLIGSHGQTVHHLPSPRPDGAHLVRSTLQIGEPAIIAERTGITTIANFRPRDLAAGGEGAPLTPLVHALLFAHPDHGRVVLNIGGIANVTVLPAGGDLAQVTGFDTGPGNVLLDEYVRTTGLTACGYDLDGRLAAAGRVVSALLDELLDHPFIRRLPPKSTGREVFGPDCVAGFLHRVKAQNIELRDGLATLTAFTARAVAANLLAFVLPQTPVQEVIVMGGGARNPTLMRALSAALPDCAVNRSDDLGTPSGAVEAMTFAVLAYLTAHGQPGNLPAVTGATAPRVLGCIVPGRTFAGLRDA
jgi:anhydro-N-acetylmuramic acid kinase